MIGSLGLSIGMTNLVAAPSSGTPAVRRAVLTLYPHRPPEVGIPSEKTSLNEQGLVFTGFVERVGDPVPVVASDGSTFRGEQLVADALEALTRLAGPGQPQAVSATVPAHWGDGVVGSLRAAVVNRPALSSRGQPMPLVSDAFATLTALQAQPGLPARGIVALCDFGATGTSITLANAAAGFRSVGPTVRYDEFSGELIDQAVLRQVLAELDVDPSNTSAVAALGRVREQCRIAKERLSHETATGFTGPLPGPQSTVRLTRGELEALLRDPLDGFIQTFEQTLQRHTIARADLVAVATAGGGASIPFVTQRLSERLRIPVITSPHPQVVAALGARLIAQRGPEDDAATGLAMAPLAAGTPAAESGETAAHTMLASAGAEPLAWSQDESIDEVASAAYSDFDDGGPTDRARPDVRFEHGEGSAVDEFAPLPWYRRPGVIFGAAACAALIAAAGLILTSGIGAFSPTPAGTTGTPTTTPPAAGPAEAPPPAPEQAPPAITETVVQRQAPNPQRQAPAPRVAPPPKQPPPPPIPSTAIVTSTTVVTSTPTPTTTASPQCTPPDCITATEPIPENCGYTGECPEPDPDPVILVPGPDPTNCGYTGECGTGPGSGSGGTTPDAGGGSQTGTGGGQTPDGGNTGGTGDPGAAEWELCPANLPPGVVC